MVWNCFLFNKVLCDSLGYQLPYVPLSPKCSLSGKEKKWLAEKRGGCGVMVGEHKCKIHIQNHCSVLFKKKSASLFQYCMRKDPTCL